MTKQYLTHRCLIAPPDMADEFFANTVVYIARHDENGAQGIIINRPSELQIKELLNDLDIDADHVQLMPSYKVDHYAQKQALSYIQGNQHGIPLLQLVKMFVLLPAKIF